MNQGKFTLFTIILFLLSVINLRAECSDWSVAIDAQSSPLCSAQTLDLSVSVQSNLSESLSSCLYRWEIKLPSATDFNEIATTASTSYTFDEVGTYTIRAFVMPNECAQYCESAPITITVREDLVAPVISGDTTICYNTAPNKLGITTEAQGGAGNYKYQWQQSEDGVNFSNISSATSKDFQPSNLIKTTRYKLVVTDDCGTVESNSVTITVREDLVAPVISGDTTICYNTAPNKLEITTGAKGGAENYKYQWQQSEDGASFTNISGANEISFQPSKLTKTTHYRLVVTDDCDTVESNSVTITVREDLVAPVISGDTTICYNTAPNKLEITTEAQGGAGNYTYQWQQSEDGVNFTNISSATSKDFQPSNLIKTTHYKLVVTDDCGTVESNSVTITVRENLVAPIISGDTTICYNTAPNKLGITTDAKGGAGNYKYQWQQSEDGVNFSNISSATSKDFQPSNLIKTTHYKLVVTDDCGTVESNSVTITVREDLVAPVIFGDTTICYNTAPNELEITTGATGGAENYKYQWQQSEDGASFTNISGANEISFQPSKLTKTTHYKLVVTDDCGTVESNSVTITVREDLVAPVISGDTTICYNTAPNELEITTGATGGAENYTYQWQQSEDGVNFTNVGATSTAKINFQPSNLKETMFYRLIVNDDCGELKSNVVKVTVLADLTVSVVEKPQPLCYQGSEKIRVSATGAGDKFTYQWQKSSDKTSFSDIEGAKDAEYEVIGENAGTFYYRCIVSPTFGCNGKTSDAVSVLVYADVIPAEIGGDTTICYGFDSEALSIISPATGGDGNFSYRWMRRTKGKTDFEYIADATSESYTPKSLTETTEYQLETKNACKTVYSNIVTISVREKLVAPVISYDGGIICYNTIPDVLQRTTDAQGGSDDSFSYQWEESNDGKTFTAISGETADVYAPSALKAMHYYRLRAVSEKLCGEVLSNVVAIQVYDSMYAVATAVSPICYQTTATISVVAQGGGNAYLYQWQQSEDGVAFQDIQAATNATYVTNNLSDGSYFYRCVVSTQKCSDVWCWSNVVKVDVYKDLTAGIIVGTDSTCYGYAPTESLHFDEKPAGVDGKYAYQWQKRTASTPWTDIVGATSDQYALDALTENTEFRVVVLSACTSKETNAILIRVNPLPVEQTISGDNNVCYNQYNLYSVDHLNSGFSYVWSLQSANGKITSSLADTTSIVVFWEIPNSHDEVLLTVTDDKTGCERIIAFPVTICNEGAPGETIIVRKPNSNILVCKENRNIFYQWGFTEKSSSVGTPIENSNRRYVLLPHAFDNNAYDYWLITRPSEDSKCRSRSVYVSENDTMISTPVAQVSMPTQIKKSLPITIQNPSEEAIICRIFDVAGRSIVQYDFGRNAFIEATIPFDVASGMYLVRIEMGDYVETYKLIAK